MIMKPNNTVKGNKMKNRLVGVLASLALTFAGLMFVGVAPAYAINFKICNDPRSDETIQAYVSSYSYTPYLEPGECSNTMVAEGTRVDVDVVCCGDRGVDVDSYKIWSASGGWGSCHNGETNSSDPPNDPGGVVYWTDTDANCYGFPQ